MQNTDTVLAVRGCLFENCFCQYFGRLEITPTRNGVLLQMVKYQ